MDEPILVELDSRRRVALGKLGNPEHRFYIVQAHQDGTIELTPAALVPVAELDKLRAKAAEA
jgi:hypothetical protein